MVKNPNNSYETLVWAMVSVLVIIGIKILNFHDGSDNAVWLIFPALLMLFIFLVYFIRGRSINKSGFNVVKWLLFLTLALNAISASLNSPTNYWMLIMIAYGAFVKFSFQAISERREQVSQLRQEQLRQMKTTYQVN